MLKEAPSSVSDDVRMYPSTCTECSVHCGSLVSVRNGTVAAIRPNTAHPGSKGAFCIKGLKGPTGLTYSDNRLLYPLRRVGERGENQWRRISWSDALDEAADRLNDVREKFGPQSIVGATNSAVIARGATMALLMRSLGSPNWMINQDLCGGCRAVSSRATGLDITRGEDIEHARCALVVGRNSYEANPIEWAALKNLKKRGGNIIVIDPKRTPAAGIADLWLRPRPGTDAALALAMMQILVAENLFDKEFIARWCHGFELLKERISAFTPSRVEAQTGVAAEDIVNAARMYGRGPSTFVSGHGIDAFSAGVQTFRAFHCLVAISGNVDRLGGNRRVKKPKGFRDYLALLHDPAFRLPKSVEEQTIGANRFPLWAGPRGWQTACHNPSVIEAILTGEPYPIRGMYISGVNIVVTYPNTLKTVKALRSLDFLMVASDTLTPTAEFADIVLPKTTALEENDIRLESNGPALTMTQAVASPRGEARCDLDIAVGILDRMSARGAMTQNFFHWRTEEEFIEYLLAGSGITVGELRRNGFAAFPYKLGDFDTRPFPSPTGKVELYSESMASVGLDPLPNFDLPARDGNPDDIKSAFPLVLLTGDREKTYHHSRFRDQDWAKKISPDPKLLVHPQTASEFALQDGQWILVKTPAAEGSCRLRVKISDATPVGVVSTGMGWWRPNSSKSGNGIFEININSAMSYDGPWDPASGSVDTRGVRCRVSPA